MNQVQSSHDPSAPALLLISGDRFRVSQKLDRHAWRAIFAETGPRPPASRRTAPKPSYEGLRVRGAAPLVVTS